MAVLSNPDRTEVWAEFMRDQSSERQSINLTKADLRAALDATDDWIEANQASFNNALPVNARTALSAKQKALLFMMVARRRFIV